MTTPAEIRTLAASNGWNLFDPIDASTGLPADSWVLDLNDGTGTRYDWDGSVFDNGTTVDLSVAFAARQVRDTRAARRVAIENAISFLETRSAVYDGTTVTSGNAVSVLQSIVDDQVLIMDRLADMIRDQYRED